MNAILRAIPRCALLAAACSLFAACNNNQAPPLAASALLNCSATAQICTGGLSPGGNAAQQQCNGWGAVGPYPPNGTGNTADCVDPNSYPDTASQNRKCQEIVCSNCTLPDCENCTATSVGFGYGCGAGNAGTGGSSLKPNPAPGVPPSNAASRLISYQYGLAGPIYQDPANPAPFAVYDFPSSFGVPNAMSLRQAVRLPVSPPKVDESLFVTGTSTSTAPNTLEGLGLTANPITPGPSTWSPNVNQISLDPNTPRTFSADIDVFGSAFAMLVLGFTDSIEKAMIDLSGQLQIDPNAGKVLTAGSVISLSPGYDVRVTEGDNIVMYTTSEPTLLALYNGTSSSVPAISLPGPGFVTMSEGDVWLAVDLGIGSSTLSHYTVNFPAPTNIAPDASRAPQLLVGRPVAISGGGELFPPLASTYVVAAENTASGGILELFDMTSLQQVRQVTLDGTVTALTTGLMNNSQTIWVTTTGSAGAELTMYNVLGSKIGVSVNLGTLNPKAVAILPTVNAGGPTPEPDGGPIPGPTTPMMHVLVGP